MLACDRLDWGIHSEAGRATIGTGLAPSFSLGVEATCASGGRDRSSPRHGRLATRARSAAVNVATVGPLPSSRERA